jgi:DNA-binding transcriptional ArsR family regulator
MLLDSSRLDEFIQGCTVGVMATVIRLDTLERVGTALADPTRRRILLALIDGPAYPADLADGFGVGRTNISNHLACLRGCGLVRATREGSRVRYELSSVALAHALCTLVDLDLDVEAHHLDLDGRP